MHPNHLNLLKCLAAAAAVFAFGAPAALMAEETETEPETVQAEESAAPEEPADPATTAQPAEEAGTAAETGTAEPVQAAAETTTYNEPAAPVFTEENTINSTTDAGKYQTIFNNTTGSLLLDNVDLSNYSISTANAVHIAGNVILKNLTTTDSGIYGTDKDTDILTLKGSYTANGTENTIENVTVDASDPVAVGTGRINLSGTLNVNNAVLDEAYAKGNGGGLYCNPDAVAFNASNSTIHFNNNVWCGIDVTNGNKDTLFRFDNCEVEINGNAGNGFQGNYTGPADTPQIIFTDSNVQANDNGKTLSKYNRYSGFSYTSIQLVNTTGGAVPYTFEASDNGANGVGGKLNKQSSLSADGYTIIANNNGDCGIKENDGSAPVIQNSTIIAKDNGLALGGLKLGNDLVYSNGTTAVLNSTNVQLTEGSSIKFDKNTQPQIDVTVVFMLEDHMVGHVAVPVTDGRIVLPESMIQELDEAGLGVPEDARVITYGEDSQYPSYVIVPTYLQDHALTIRYMDGTKEVASQPVTLKAGQNKISQDMLDLPEGYELDQAMPVDLGNPYQTSTLDIRVRKVKAGEEMPEEPETKPEDSEEVLDGAGSDVQEEETDKEEETEKEEAAEEEKEEEADKEADSVQESQEAAGTAGQKTPATGVGSGLAETLGALAASAAGLFFLTRKKHQE